MLAKDIMADVRFSVGDMGKVKYSDHQLVNAINQVMRQINTTLCNITSDIVKTRVTLALTNGSVSLPIDYDSLIKITTIDNLPMYYRTSENNDDSWTYELIGGMIYANQSSVVLTYKKSFPEFDVNDTNVTLPLPDFFKDLVSLYVKVALQGAVSSGDSTVLPPLDAAVRKKVAGRDKGRMRFKPSFVGR